MNQNGYLKTIHSNPCRGFKFFCGTIEHHIFYSIPLVSTDFVGVKIIFFWVVTIDLTDRFIDHLSGPDDQFTLHQFDWHLCLGDFFLHMLRITSPPDLSTNFDQAFGLQWEGRINPAQKNHFLQSRRIVMLPQVPRPRME